LDYLAPTDAPQDHAASGGSALSKPRGSAWRQKSLPSFKISHMELEELKLIEWTDPDLRKAVLKKCMYKFKMGMFLVGLTRALVIDVCLQLLVNSGEFLVEPKLKKGISFKLLKEPIVLHLDELLRMQQDNETTLKLEYLTLNVNLLVHMLNTRLLARSK
jgi:hypothetical protein